MLTVAVFIKLPLQSCTCVHREPGENKGEIEEWIATKDSLGLFKCEIMYKINAI